MSRSRLFLLFGLQETLPYTTSSRYHQNQIATEGSGTLGSGGTYANDDRLLDVKHDLFPMCIFRMGTSTKPHRLMTRFKPNIKPSDQRMNKIVPRRTKFKVRDKSEIRNSASSEINIEDTIGICDDGFKFDGVDERFSHCNSSDGRKIETVNRFPKPDFFFFVVCVFDACNVQGCVVGENETTMDLY
jgi:hypothetical protein